MLRVALDRMVPDTKYLSAKGFTFLLRHKGLIVTATLILKADIADSAAKARFVRNSVIAMNSTNVWCW